MISVALNAAPPHQFKQLYVYGEHDDCLGKLSNVYNCFKKHTKFADEVEVGSHAFLIIQTQQQRCKAKPFS